MDNGNDKKTKVVIGLSGGVDSSVAAWLLKRQGYDVVGLFMINWHDTAGTLEGDCPWYDDRMFAELVAKRLDIPFHVVDLSEQYRARVVDYMFAEYERGRTPNPDVLCNREIKFDVFLKEAVKLGADYVATGHYCRRVDETVGGVAYHRLLAGADPNKDQSYFLCQLSQEQLSKSLFPIGGMLKPEVRRIAEEQKLATAKRKDSQGICFVGKVDLPVFLQQKLAPKAGDVIEIPSDWAGYRAGAAGLPIVGAAGLSDPGGMGLSISGTAGLPVPGFSASAVPDLSVTSDPAAEEPSDATLAALAEPWRYTRAAGTKAGEHTGAHYYTIGQRKGVGVSGKPLPVFVLATDVERNIVYVGQGQEHPGLYRRGLFIKSEEIHWVSPDRALSAGESARFRVRIRYRQSLQDAALYVRDEGAYIVFDEPQRGITPGQFAAWYSGDELVGSGVINE